MNKRFLIIFTYILVLVLLILSGSSCINYIVRPESSIASWLPATESEFKSYVTPDCPLVQEAIRDILGNEPYESSQLGFDEIRDWVALNIEYTSDEKRWGKDYWQTPEETLTYRTGDCEDFAILLCSFLRAYGIDAARVFVALGVDDSEDGHAFLLEDWYSDGEWRRVESQSPAQLSSWDSLIGFSTPDSRLDQYDITAIFNDLHYNDESFSHSAKQANPGVITKVITVVRDIFQSMLQLASSLLGLLLS